MKIYADSVRKIMYIDIVAEYFDDAIEMTKTIPFGKINLTEQEIADFNDFVEDIGGLMYDFDFEIKDEHPSNRTNSTSYYYAFYPTDSDSEVCYENLYFLRISNHVRKSEGDNPYPKYYKETAQKYRMSKNKTGIQHHRRLNVIVNDKIYSDYDDAFEAVKKKFKNLQQKCDKLNGK